MILVVFILLKIEYLLLFFTAFQGGLFDGDVVVFGGVEDLSTVLAFDEFGVVLAGDDLDDGMFAGRDHGVFAWILSAAKRLSTVNFRFEDTVSAGHYTVN